jgi:hypothetical protein
LAIERSNLTKYVSTAGVAKRKHSTFSREHGKSDAAFHDKVQRVSSVSSAEDKLTLFIGGFAHLRSHSASVRLSERAKQIRATEQCDN